MINKKLDKTEILLLGSFFLSGSSALIYQMVWQRALHGAIGVDMDSITIIVSVFMLGIGFGGMLGGWLADKHQKYRLRLYAATEITIAIYGATSLSLLNSIIEILSTLGAGGGASAIISMTFLIIPTTLMGMTLPLLTMAFNEHNESIGNSVGMLYFSNTIGAAFGAAIVPFFLLPHWNLREVTFFAVAGNLASALLIGAAQYKQTNTFKANP